MEKNAILPICPKEVEIGAQTSAGASSSQQCLHDSQRGTTWMSTGVDGKHMPYIQTTERFSVMSMSEGLVDVTAEEGPQKPYAQ